VSNSHATSQLWHTFTIERGTISCVYIHESRTYIAPNTGTGHSDRSTNTGTYPSAVAGSHSSANTSTDRSTNTGTCYACSYPSTDAGSYPSANTGTDPSLRSANLPSNTCPHPGANTVADLSDRSTNTGTCYTCSYPGANTCTDSHRSTHLPPNTGTCCHRSANLPPNTGAYVPSN
jgi:hypothetical protein